MSKAEDKEALKVAFQAALEARQETFLARYPRKLKLFVLVLLLFMLGAGVWSVWPKYVDQPAETQEQQTAEESKIIKHEEEPLHFKDEAAKKTTPAEERQACWAPKTDIERKAAVFNDANQTSTAMAEAPDMNLVERSAYGYLPRTGQDGREPWTVYARGFDKMDPRARIAVVIGDLGLSRIATDAALRRLPPAVTLAFDAQSDAVGEWLKRARQDGHETLLSVPMEPLDFPRSDPGPNALLTTLPNTDNLDRFHSFLAKGTGYVGVTTMTGSRFANDAEKILPIMEDIKVRGLLVLDTRLVDHSVVTTVARQLEVPVATISYVIDQNPSPRAIDEVLTRIEQTAQREGQVIALASPLPVTIERLALWTKGLADRGAVLVPLSAVVR